MLVVLGHQKKGGDIATGCLEPSAYVQNVAHNRRKTSSSTVSGDQPCIQESMLKGEHATMVSDALTHATMVSFQITGPLTECRLLVCPGQSWQLVVSQRGTYKYR